MIPMIDYLSASINIENYIGSTEDILIKLEQLKNQAKLTQNSNMSEKTLITIGDQTFYILSNGSKGYAYILHNDYYEVRFAQFRSENEAFFPIFIKIKSECLWSIGPFEAWLNITQWIYKYIGKIITNKLNRIDLCCHTDKFNLSYADFDKFRGRFDNQELYSSRRIVSGFTFGSRNTGRIFCRIYDKSKEINKKRKKLWFNQIWEEKGLDTENIWNIEFEINRKFLSEYKIETVERAFQMLQSIWNYCTYNWLIKINLDNIRRERCSINDKWLPLQNAFEDYSSLPLIKRTDQLDYDSYSLVPGAIGNITSYAARRGITNISTALLMLKKDGHQYLDKAKNMTFQNNIEGKIKIINQEGR